MAPLLLAAAPALLLFLAIVWQPSLGALLLLGVTPLIVGIERGAVGLPLRPNEMLVLFVLLALLVRTLMLMLAGSWRPVPIERMDLALLALAAASSVVPLLWREARGYALAQDDVLYSVVLAKYYLLYRIFRTAVSRPEEIAACVAVCLLASAAVAVVAMLQVSHLLGVPQLLHAYYDQPFEGGSGVLVERGTSTIASAFGLGDMMIMSLVLTLALLIRSRRHRVKLLLATPLYLGGCMVSGEFSIYIGLVVAVVAFGALSGMLRRLVPLGLAAAGALAVPFWSVVDRRLADFQGEAGMPHSWQGRIENLERFFLPDLLSGLNWLLGVRPAPRVPAPESWRNWVYIESGYVWLLWIGGVPFLLAFAWFVASAWSALRREAARADIGGAVATAALCFLAALLVLMLVDPHLTVRGGADLFFPLLALALVPLRQPRAAPWPVRSPLMSPLREA